MDDATPQPNIAEVPNHPDDLGVFPKQIRSSRTLSFQKHWFDTYHWLHYDPSICGVICYYCSTAQRLSLLGLSRSKEEAFISKGYRNWKDALSSFAIHARSPSHTFSVERVAHFHKAQPVNSQLASQLAGEQAEARSALQIIFTSVQYLARQGLAFRGHTVDEGNFMQILKLRTRDNPKFHRWVDRKVDYTTPQAQNEILLQFSHAVVRQIAQDVKANRIFSVIVDGTQDAGRKEQMSVCIRHVDDNFIPHEEFVGMYEPPNTTGATIATCIKDVLLRLDLSLQNLRGQTYDGASNMSGPFNGCQAVICQSQPLALYVHCGAHCVNLVSQSVNESCTSIRDALQVVNDLGVLFAQSIVARTKFKDLADPSASHFHQIRPLCPTRWLVRVKAIQAVVTQYELVLQCLEELDAPGCTLASRARGLHKQLCQASIHLFLHMALRVFEPLERLNRSLQATYQTVAGMMEAVTSVIVELTAIRTDEEFELLMAETCKVQTELNLDALEVPRTRKPPARYTGPAAATIPQSAADYYRPKYFEIVDDAVVKLEQRFTKSTGLNTYAKLERILLSGEITEDDNKLLNSYPEISEDDLGPQLRMFRRTRQVSSLKDVVSELQNMLPEVRGEYPDVCNLTKLLLVSPASSAEAERTFSALRRLKTWLRTTMTETRLNSVTVCHIHRHRLDKLDLKPLLRDFVLHSEIRSSLFGQFV